MVNLDFGGYNRLPQPNLARFWVVVLVLVEEDGRVSRGGRGIPGEVGVAVRFVDAVSKTKRARGGLGDAQAVFVAPGIGGLLLVSVQGAPRRAALLPECPVLDILKGADSKGNLPPFSRRLSPSRSRGGEK